MIVHISRSKFCELYLWRDAVRQHNYFKSHYNLCTLQWCVHRDVYTPHMCTLQGFFFIRLGQASLYWCMYSAWKHFLIQLDTWMWMFSRSWTYLGATVQYHKHCNWGCCLWYVMSNVQLFGCSFTPIYTNNLDGQAYCNDSLYYKM